jgi:hypothetical protein
MLEFLRRLAKRWYVRYTIKLKYSRLNEKQTTSDSEKICKSICYRLINEEDSKFLIAPISGKRYINNKRLDLFVILDDRRISITDHIYHYDVILTDRDWDRVTIMYDNRTEKIRQNFEDNVRSQINNSLHKILDKIHQKN